MIKILKILTENIKFNNWIQLSEDDIKLEYNVEYKNHIIYSFGDIFPTYEDFKFKVKNGIIKKINKDFDNKISNRSQTTSYEGLLSLIKGYRSYPEYRNEKTLNKIYEAFKNNKPMKMPIVLYHNGRYFIMSGNTRMDIAFQLGIDPKVIIVNV